MDIQAIFLDISGVLIDGTKPIQGAVASFNKLQSTSLPVRLVTNTSRKPKNAIVTELQQLGFQVNAAQVFSAASAAKDYVIQQRLRPYCLVHHNLKKDFADIDQNQPNAVVIGDAEHDFTYANLDKAFQLCHQGAPLIGIGGNKYFKIGNQFHLDSGSFVHMIEHAADCKAVVMGKPSKDFFDLVIADVGIDPEHILMVGDDVRGDVQGAIDAGMQGCLVRTGKYQQGDETVIAPERRWVAGNVVEVIEELLS